MTAQESPPRPWWHDLFKLERPLPPTPASRRLRWLIAVTALVTVVVEAVNLAAADEPGYALTVRTAWALLRVVGFLVLMRAVRFGRLVARPLGLVLAVTTVFAVARLVVPREGSLVPRATVLAGLIVMVGLCAALVWALYRSPAVAAHLSGRPVRRHIPGWVLTARVAALAFTALMWVPFGVAVGTADLGRPVTAGLLLFWGWLGFLVAVIVPWTSFFVVLGKSWARRLITVVSVVLLVVQPALCVALLGADGLLRDGLPMIMVALLTLYALYRSRGQATWYRPGRVEAAGGA